MKKKILILGGGSGDVGRDVTRILLTDRKIVDNLTVTSRNLAIAKEFVNCLKDDRINPEKLDVTDIPNLMRVIKDHDLIVNTVGPFYRYTIPIIKAAIEKKVDYIDICDDIEPTWEALQLDSFAKKAGISVLLCMGWFPGMSNLRAKALSEQMDKVEEVVTAWVLGKKAADDEPSYGMAGTEHFIRALTREIVSFRNGHRVKIPAFHEGLKLKFPKPLGPYICYQLEHPEPVTLPYVISGIKTASNLGSLYPPNRNKFIRLLTRAIDFRLISFKMANTILEILSKNRSTKTFFPKMIGSYIALIGTKNGEKGQLRYSSTNTCVTTAEATSQSLVCAIFNNLTNNKIKPGVHLPETAIEINDLINIGIKLKLPFFTEAIEETIWTKEIDSMAEN